MTDISSPQIEQSFRVQSAVAHSELKMDTSGPLWGAFQSVDASEINSINNTITALETRSERDAAWEQIDHSAFIEAMYITSSVDDRTTILTNIARDADPETAAQFVATLSESGHTIQGRDRLQEFSEIYARHASPADRVAFIEELSPGMAEADTFGGRLSSTTADKEALAAATVLNSLSGSFAREAVGNLSPAELSAMTDATIEIRRASATGQARDHHDASAFPAFANTIALYGTTPQKATVFDRAGDTLFRIQNKGWFHGSGADIAMPQIANGMSKLIVSDANGVMDALFRELGAKDAANGQALSAYTRQLVDDGTPLPLARIQAQLLGQFDTHSPSFNARFNTAEVRNGVEVYTNAETLGYFAGAVQNGVSLSHAGEAEKAAFAREMVELTTGIVGGAIAIPSAGWGLSVTVAGQAAGRGLEAYMTGERAEYDTLISGSSLPRGPDTGAIIASSASLGAFQTSKGSVINARETYK